MPNSTDIRLSESSNSSTGVSAVAIKTPAFWSDKPELWFAQLESQFALENISVDSTKFHYVTAALNSDNLTCVSDLVLNPPQTDSYNSLKTRLIAQNADSESVRLKKLLSVSPSPDARLSLTCDASDRALGSVLSQEENVEWKPLAFFSRKLTPAEQRYSVYDRELLAVYASVRHFSYVLEGRNFTIYTDHKPLIYALTQKHEKCSPCQIQHLDWIGQFSTDIRHISGSLNMVADSLSRISEIEMPSPIDYKEFTKVQLSDKEFQLLKSCTNSLKFQFLKVSGMDTDLFCDVSTGRCRPFVPKEFAHGFLRLHNLSHPGVKATQGKIQCHTVSPLGTYPVPRHRFDHVHIDLVGLLPPSCGYTYALTCVDRFSHWPEAIPHKDINAETVSFEFYANWIARLGVPERFTSDQGRQFERRLFREFARLLGVKVVHTTPYHPQAMVQWKDFTSS
ncbi:Transposon Tf2-6 polyprotein [Araneus ventricosus]|uniref:Transposon Tf2-6 polyprotein n=1 Tax=Araneus ventricosus TaxID=182803 RepID=A0A4Y2BI68_ARAVE|nr:Transposon Tf2-6 polyprotein [Araneus ventricosus]